MRRRARPYRQLSVARWPDVVAASAKAERVLWFGALSFEERCVGSLATLAASGVRVDRIVLLNYPTEVSPADEGERRRALNIESIEELARGGLRAHTETITVLAHSFSELQAVVRQQLSTPKTFCIWDISCLTKIHTIAMAVELAATELDVRWASAYTIPESYNLGDRSAAEIGWDDIVVAPLADTATLVNEGDGRGLILPGHEGDRLVVALAELEPSGGLIMIAETTGRPDLRALTERRNQKVLRQLTSLRASNWSRTVIGTEDIEGTSRVVEEQVRLARAKRAPVIMFPYGPKALVFAAASELMGRYPEASWFVYPIPSRYEAAHSQGVGSTTWIGRRRPELI
jgi:hypothetical protein